MRIGCRIWYLVRPIAVMMMAYVLSVTVALAQDLDSFEKRVTQHTLKNGWTFILVERPVAPVFSFITRVNVGSAQEGAGQTGLAHMFEHMAFKGTPRIGTKDYQAEKVALVALEESYQAYQTEKFSRNADPEKVKSLYDTFKQRQREASQYVIKNEFGEIIEREGGVALNAFTGADVTGYFYSLPANKVELFAYLESERFLQPVFREFYEERDVVMEERRLRTESQPFGRLLEQFVATAFMAHPYHHPVIGYASDIQTYTLTDAKRFYETQYVPTNMVTAIVGDIEVKAVISLLEKYFGRIPAGSPPSPIRTVEPPSITEKTVILHDPSQPLYLEGYHKPAVTHVDQPVYDAIDDILTNGRTSRLFRSLVRDKQIAVSVGAYGAYPGDKYPHIWMAYGVPGRSVSNQTVQQALREEFDKLKTQDVSDEELARFRTRAKAGLLRALNNNLGLAMHMSDYHMLFGDWRELFRDIRRFEQVTKDDIRRVAKVLFQPTNRIVGMIETVPPPGVAIPSSAAEGEGQS